jgi:hypothetical protein
VKKLLLIACLLLMATLMFADRSDTLAPYQFNLALSAPIASGITIANVDIDTIAPIRAISTSKLFYSTNSQSSWNEVSATLIGGTSYPYTYTANISNPASSDVYYYFHFESDSTWAGQSPFTQVH